MSFKEVEELIQHAPDVAAWWKSNTKTLKFWCVARNLSAAIGGFLVLFAGLSTAVVGALWFMDNIRPGSELLAAAFPCFLALGVAMVELPSRLRPKRFTFGKMKLNKMNCAVSVEKKRSVLNAALKITDPKIKNILLQLQDIKDLELPDVWWEQLETAVQNILQQAAPVVVVVEQSAQQQLDDVYMKMERAAHENSSKVLRL